MRHSLLFLAGVIGWSALALALLLAVPEFWVTACGGDGAKNPDWQWPYSPERQLLRQLRRHKAKMSGVRQQPTAGFLPQMQVGGANDPAQ